MDIREKLVESSLSRIWAHFNAHDSAIITAFRHKMINCANDTPQGVNREATQQLEPAMASEAVGDDQQQVVSLADNKSNNAKLKATLMKLGYGLTKTDGVYIENFNTNAAKEVKEDSLLVINLKDDPSFIQKIQSLGKYFCQDSVLIIPKGGKGAYLVGTNNSEFPGMGQKYPVGDFKPAQSAEFMSKVGNRPFHFAEGTGLLESFDKLNNNTKFIVTSVSKNIIEKL